MTSKYGFSVVAPIRVISPFSTAGSRWCRWASLKRWISSRKRIVPLAVRAQPLAGAGRGTPRTSATLADTAESSSNAAPVERGDNPRQRRLPDPGWAEEYSRAERGPPRSPGGGPSPRRAHAPGPRTRRASSVAAAFREAGVVRTRVNAAASANRSDMCEVCSADVEGGSDGPCQTTSGRSSTAPARATTSGTCGPTSCSALQKTPEERAHHDELLFQRTHQSSELWLKLAGEEMELATAHLAARRARAGAAAARPRRSSASSSLRSSSTCSS